MIKAKAKKNKKINKKIKNKKNVQKSKSSKLSKSPKIQKSKSPKKLSKSPKIQKSKSPNLYKSPSAQFSSHPGQCSIFVTPKAKRTKLSKSKKKSTFYPAPKGGLGL
jgi:hypothetical protein